MGTMMAPRASQDSAATPKPTKGRAAKTKAGATPDSAMSSASPLNPSNKPSHAPSVQLAASPDNINRNNIGTAGTSTSTSKNTKNSSNGSNVNSNQTPTSSIVTSHSISSTSVGSVLGDNIRSSNSGSSSSNSRGGAGVGAMNVNANIKPNLQPAPTQAQQARASHLPQNNRQTGGAPTALQQLQHPRPSSIVHHQRHHPGSPAQPQTHTQYSGSPESAGRNIGIQQQQHQQQHQFLPGHQVGGNETQHANQGVPYLHGPYGHQPGAVPIAEDGRVLMAATMPPYSNIYSNNQPQSPASVSSPHSHDTQGRQMFGSGHPHLASTMYPNYAPYQQMGHVHQNPYSHPARSQAPLLLSSHHSSPQMPQQHHHQQQHHHHQQQQQQHQQQTQQQQSQQSRSPTGVHQSPRQKLEPSVMPMHRSIDTSGAMQRQPQQVITSTAAQVPPGSAGSVQQSPRSGGGPNSSAAPGPIPASTPRVIREDSDGTLWIEFEYSKDRVKMDYSIKCNIESVNTDELSDEFKSNNCVYPRAMKPKEQYTGNRYGYETECNAVGWALAKMNETLQGKRGLIQRAVDSWRNSSQDTKLRSRRVRRQQKIAKRDKERNSSGPSQGAVVVPGTPISTQRPQSMHGSVDMTGGAHAYQQHPHHPGVGGGSGVVGGSEDVVTGAGRFIRPTPEAAYAPSMSLSMSMSNTAAPSSYHQPHQHHQHPAMVSSPTTVPPSYASNQHHHAHGIPVSYAPMTGPVQYYHGGTA